MNTSGLLGIIRDKDENQIGGFFKWRLSRGKQPTCTSPIFWLTDIPESDFSVQLFSGGGNAMEVCDAIGNFAELPSNKTFNELHRASIKINLNILGYETRGANDE